MANIKRWSNVSITIESAKAAALTVTAISKASPGMVEYTGTDPVDGSYVLMTVAGMYQVDGRVFRVDEVDGATDDFELQGENTTSYDTFTSGTAEVVTFGTTLATATGLTVSGGEAQVETIYYVSENFGRDIPGPTTPKTYSLDCTWDPADTGLVALKADADEGRAESRRALDQVEQALDATLARAALRPDQIDIVLRTGGSSLIPAVRRILDDRFPTQVVDHDPFTSVAAGLAIASYQKLEFAPQR